MFKLSRFEAYIIFSVIFFIFPLICFLQGLPGDTSSDPRVHGFDPNIFYRPIVGGDEAWWDDASSLIFSHNPFDISPSSFFLGYINLGQRFASSSLYIFYLYLLKTVFRNPYLVMAAKGLIDLGGILWIYRSSCADFVKSQAYQLRIVSITCLVVLCSPFFWWWAFSYQRDDLLVVLSCYLLLLFSKMTAGIIQGPRYIFLLLANCVIFSNLKLYSLILPFTLLIVYLFDLKKKYFLNISRTILLLFLLACAYLMSQQFLDFFDASLGFVYVVFKTLTSFFKPLPTNVLTIEMGEAAPLKLVYLFNSVIVFSGFLYILVIALLRPSGFINSIYQLLPIVVANLAYRFILSAYDGDILGVRQCMTVLPFDLYIIIYFLARYITPVRQFITRLSFSSARPF